MAYRLPTARVLEVYTDTDEDIVRTCLTLLDRQEYLSYPIAPAWLRAAPSASFELHQLVAFEANRLTFETYATEKPVLSQNLEVSFMSQWLPNALDVVLDLQAVWSLLPYNNNQGDWCPLTYGYIWADREGYYSQQYGWISVAGHNELLVRDRFRLRRANKNLTEQEQNSRVTELER